jgi:hypothetical protein
MTNNSDFIGNSSVTPDIFFECLTELEKFYDKQLTDFARLAYKNRIGECRELNNSNLCKATLFCIGKHSAGGKFFPSAEKIIEYAVGSPEERISRQNQKILTPSADTEDIERVNRFFQDFRNLLKKTEKKEPSPVSGEDTENRSEINKQILEKWRQEGQI